MRILNIMRIRKKSRGPHPYFSGYPFSNIIMRTQRTRWVQKSYFFTTLSRKLCSFNPTDNVYFRKETKKNRCPCNYLGNGSKHVFVRVELIFPLFCLFQGKNHNSNRSPQSRRHRWVQCHSLNGTVGFTVPNNVIVNGTVGFNISYVTSHQSQRHRWVRSPSLTPESTYM